MKHDPFVSLILKQSVNSLNEDGFPSTVFDLCENRLVQTLTLILSCTYFHSNKMYTLMTKNRIRDWQSF